MTAAASPAAGTQLFLLEQDGILFCEKRQELHVLNTTATVIWCLLEQGAAERDIAQDLAVRFAVPDEQAAGYVAAALEDWAGKGLLAGSEGPPRPTPPPGWIPLAGLPDYPGAALAFVATRRYRLLSTRFAVRFSSDAQMAQLHPVLAHLEVADQPDVVFDLIAVGDRTILYCDNKPQDACDTNDALVPIAYGVIWMTALRRHDFFLNIHAGVLRTPVGCVLLPAPQGSGKSTLTAALVQSGFEYFSDEVALLDNDLLVAPFPQAICVKEGGIAALDAVWPGATKLALHRRPDGKRVGYLAPPADRLPAPDDRETVRALIFPRYAASTRTSCVEVPKAAALARLFGQCTVLEGRLDAGSVGRLVDWMKGVTCRELIYGVTSDAVEAVNEVTAVSRSSRRTRNTQTAK